MKQNNTLVWQMKRTLLQFSEKISDGLTRPKLKFLVQMLYGMLASHSVMLTDIGRSLQEEISLKKLEDRLSRNLKDFRRDIDCVRYNYLETVKPFVDEETIFCLDPGDICKKNNRHQEGMGPIHDGSERRIAFGWQLIEMTALTHKKKLPIPVYTRVVSPSDPMADTQTMEILSAIRACQQTFGPVGIFTMDRAMDTNAIYAHCFATQQRFIIRARMTRNLMIDDETVEVAQIAKQMRGGFHLEHVDKHGIKRNLKASFRPVRLPNYPDKTLTLVVITGFSKDPFLLLTNLSVEGKQTCLRVAKTYLCRWRTEEYYRFKKNQFCLENIRVRSLDSICSLVFLQMLLSGWLAILANKKGESELLAAIFLRAKRVYEIPDFTLYAVADGIFHILKFAAHGITFALLRPPRSQQLSLFSPCIFNYSAA